MLHNCALRLVRSCVPYHYPRFTSVEYREWAGPTFASSLAPLGSFPWFKMGEHLSFFRSWAANGEVRCGRFYQEEGLLSLESLGEQYESLPMDTWHYRQLCADSTPVPHFISVLYKILQLFIFVSERETCTMIFMRLSLITFIGWPIPALLIREIKKRTTSC